MKRASLNRATAAALFGVALGGATASHAQQVHFLVDSTQDRSPISPLIYGINAPIDQPPFRSTGATLSRQGGNRWTAYNYLTNASNAGADYKYENDNYLGGGSTPAGAVMPFVKSMQAIGASPLLTVPIVGYVAGDEAGPVNGGAVPTTPPSQSKHFVPEFPTPADDPAAGTPDAKDHVYQNRFVEIVRDQMASTPNLPLNFDLDNEPDLWGSTHPEVHPGPLTYAELVERSTAYAKMIKSVAPKAVVFGFVSYGWNGFVSLQNAPDAAANGDFISYFLKKMSAASDRAGRRLIDVLDLHWYPEATGPNAAGQPTRIDEQDASPGVVNARLQAPRSLWDPTYVETSWFTRPDTGPGGTQGKAIRLIPSVLSKIARNYPGTKLAFSEYDYGAGDSISGALAEADVLGLFGKFGVYEASEWPNLSSEPFTLGAFKMFRNYDGHNACFGDTSVLASNSDPVNASVYAAIDSRHRGRLTLVLINKKPTEVPASVSLTGEAYTDPTVYQLTASRADPVAGGNANITGHMLQYTMPGYSVSTISLHAAARPKR